ncbi:MAG: hypothetical protein GYA17_20360, partial [Chloroflexi bacterium]|nr:hypothetical protein [Chloroflexota bacterium]
VDGLRYLPGIPDAGRKWQGRLLAGFCPVFGPVFVGRLSPGIRSIFIIPGAPLPLHTNFQPGRGAKAALLGDIPVVGLAGVDHARGRHIEIDLSLARSGGELLDPLDGTLSGLDWVGSFLGVDIFQMGAVESHGP